MNLLKFLYKFERGAAPSSFGIYIAKMAGIKDKIISNAKKHAQLFD